MGFGRGFRAVLAAATVAGLAGCSGGDGPAEVAAGCAPAKGTALVALADPKGLVATDATIPAVSAAARYRALVTPLTRVSVALDQASLDAAAGRIAARTATGAQVAAEFFRAKRITVARQGSGPVVVATTADPTRGAAAAFYAEALRRAGYTVRTTAVADDRAIVAALKAGTVQVAPQFTGAALASLQPGAGKDRSLQRTMLALGTAGRKSGVVYAVPARAGLRPVYAVSAEVARTHGLTSLADFARRCSGSGTVLAADATCAAAGGCADGLAATYGIAVGRVTPVDTAPAAGAAVRDGRATIVALDPALVR